MNFLNISSSIIIQQTLNIILLPNLLLTIITIIFESTTYLIYKLGRL